MTKQTAPVPARTLTTDEKNRVRAAVSALFAPVLEKKGIRGYLEYSLGWVAAHPEGDGFIVEVEILLENLECEYASDYELVVRLTGEFKLPEGHKAPEALLDRAMDRAEAEREADAYARRAETGFGYCGGW
jgi:hypothetical protein